MEDKRFKVLIQRKKKGEIVKEIIFLGTKEQFEYLEKRGYFK